MKKNIVCPCGNNIPFEYDEEINIDSNTEVLEKIFTGSFMSLSCPSCKKQHKPEYKITLFWKSKNYNLLVIPELERGSFYLNKKEILPYETVIGFPEMAERLAVIKDGLEPVVIETLKSYLVVKAEESYPDKDINIWYHCSGPSGIEYHIDGIRQNEIAVMIIPETLYIKTLDDYNKQPKKPIFTSLRIRSYLSIQNLLRPDALK